MQPTEYSVNLYRWATIVATLTLDLAAPHVPRMSLQLPENFRTGLRRIVSDLRGQGFDPEISPAYAEGLLELAAQQYGRSFADYLYLWGCQVFQSGEPNEAEANVYLWNRFVRSTGNRNQHRPFPPPFIRRLREVLAQIPQADVYGLRPSTEWDKSIYAWRKYDKFYTAMDAVQATINYCDFLRAWSTVRREMPLPSFLEPVREWGVKIAQEMGPSLEHFGEPGAWADLPEGPHAFRR